MWHPVQAGEQVIVCRQTFKHVASLLDWFVKQKQTWMPGVPIFCSATTEWHEVGMCKNNPVGYVYSDG